MKSAAMATRTQGNESSLRTAPGEWIDIAHTTRAENTREVTLLNFVFWPADRIYFKLFPRSEQELDRIIKNQHRSESPIAQKLAIVTRYQTAAAM